MLILIYGEDTFRSREWLRELESKFREKFDTAGYNLARFDGATDIGELRSAITAPPFLGTKRMVVATELMERAGKKEGLAEILAHVPESTIVILWESGDEKSFSKIPLFGHIAKAKDTKCYSFPAFRGIELERWVVKRAQALGIMFASGARTEFVTRIGADLWQINAELEKLGAHGAIVTKERVKEFVRGTTPENIFGFIDALSARQPRQALAILANERERGTTVQHLLAMIARQFRMFRIAADYLTHHTDATPAAAAAEFGWHPFVAKKVLAQVRQFSLPELTVACDALFETDRFIKSGARDADTALDLLVATLLDRQSAKSTTH